MLRLYQFCSFKLIAHFELQKAVWLVWLVFSFGFKTEAAPSNDSTFYSYSYDSTYTSYVFLKQVRYYYDEESSYSINDVAKIPSEQFVLAEELGDSVRANGAYWARFKLENKTGRYLHEALSVTTSTKSFTIYKNVNGHFEFAATVDREMTRDERMLPFMVNQLPITIGVNETIEFIVRIENKESYISKNWHPLFSWNEKVIVHSKMNNITSQLFFTGVYLVFILMSLVMFFAFRDKIFIYFSLFILSAAYYFMAAKGLLIHYFGFEDTGFWFASRLELGIIGLVTSVALFINEYILFKKNLPKLFTVSTIVAIGYLLLVIADRFFSNHLLIIYNIQNTLLPIWILLVLFSSVLLIRRRLRAAKILFISMLILALSAMLDSVNYLVGGGLTWTRDAIQFGVFGFSSVLFYGLFDKITSIQKEKAMHKIEKEKSNELLFNILPAEVAKELINTGEYKAKQVQQASVLFTDFIGFTQIAAELNAADLVKEINICFQAFDHICVKYGIEKIKTIGDSYMAVAGLTSKEQGQVSTSNISLWTRDLTLAALEMQAFLQKRSLELAALNLKTFSMRCGIHTGPIVAGIVGVKKFQYDIWGDTVNTASRMESHGEVGKVNISEATYLLLKDDDSFEFEAREELEIKGKGLMKTYFGKLS